MNIQRNRSLAFQTWYLAFQYTRIYKDPSSYTTGPRFSPGARCLGR